MSAAANSGAGAVHAGGPRIIVALDYPSAAEALALAARLTPQACRLKVGMELYTAAGPALVQMLVQRGFDVFLDLKFHDIPNTVAGACRSAAALGVWMMNVHALGGRRMLEAAREALAAQAQRPLLIAVTLLTSMDAADMRGIGLAGEPGGAVAALAALAHGAGLDGVVCSAQEAAALRQAHGAEFRLVTPGIRLAADAGDDQRRVMTPRLALAAGADYLVIGRPITQAPEPLAVLEALNRDMAAVAAGV